MAVTLDLVPTVTQTNFENIEQINTFYFPKCLINLGNFLLSIIFFSVFVLLPIIEIIIGVIYINDCSMNNYIPIYLIIAGFISMICLMFAVLGWFFVWPLIDDFKFKTIKSLFVNAKLISKILIIISIFIILFGLAWFITGNIWIYSNQSHVQYTNRIVYPNTYCNHIVYLTSFWSIIIKYIFIWLIICRLSCYVCFDIEQFLKKHNQK